MYVIIAFFQYKTHTHNRQLHTQYFRGIISIVVFLSVLNGQNVPKFTASIATSSVMKLCAKKWCHLVWMRCLLVEAVVHELASSFLMYILVIKGDRTYMTPSFLFFLHTFSTYCTYICTVSILHM